MLAALRSERDARLVVGAHLQSCLGTGAAYVVLLVVAHDRAASSWAITGVLTAGFLPAALLGPVLGAAADRFGHRRCLILADLIRAAAFGGVLALPSFGALLAMAFVAGFGNALFSPALQAAAPGLVPAERLPAFASLLGAARDLGWVLGPPLAALVLAVAGTGPVLALNVATFLISAAVLSRVGFAPQAAAEDDGDAAGGTLTGLVRDARTGVVALRGQTTVMVVIVAGAALTLVGSMQNVAEPLLAIDTLGAGTTGFAMVALASTLGTLVGTVTGSSQGEVPALRRRLVQGAALNGAGYAVAACAPSLAVAMAGIGLAGVGVGWILVAGQLLLQRLVAAELLGRTFGLVGSLENAAFLLAMLGAGTLAGLFDARVVLGAAAVGALVVWGSLSRWLRTVREHHPVVVAPSAAPEAA